MPDGLDYGRFYLSFDLRQRNPKPWAYPDVVVIVLAWETSPETPGRLLGIKWTGLFLLQGFCS